MIIQRALIEGVLALNSIKQDDGIAVILLICFLISAYLFGRSKKFLFYQGKSFILHKERSSLFNSSTSSDVQYLLFLILQTCTLAGIFFLCYFETINPVLFQNISLFTLLGIYAGTLLLYVLLKWFFYSFLGNIFFNSTLTKLWLESYSTLLYYLSLVLFFPVLLLIYFDLDLCLITIIGAVIIIIAKLLLLYKWIKFFFNKTDDLFPIILYFCALEIIPCFIYYKVLILINNILLIKF